MDPAWRGTDEWGDAEFWRLSDDAARWARVRGAGVVDPELFLAEVVAGLWGARLDGDGGRLEVAPFIPEGWRSMAVRRLRAHRTLLDLEVRRRAEWATVKLAVRFGPPIPLALSLRNTAPIARVTVDEIPLERSRAIFTARDEHEVVFFNGSE